MTLVGIVLAYPHDDSAGPARNAIDLPFAVLENFGYNFAVAAETANILGELYTMVDALIEKSQRKEVFRLETMQLVTSYSEVERESLMNGNYPVLPSMDESLGFFNVTTPDLRGVSAQSIEIVATDMYDDLDLSSINDGYLN